MFIIDQDITDLKSKENSLFKVLFSMNVHQVATPDTSIEDARSYVFFFREGKEKISAYVGLHFIHVHRQLFYTYSSNPFADDQLSDVEDEARNFAEDLGAMLDEIDFSKMSDMEKCQWVEDQEILAGSKIEVKSLEEAIAPTTSAAQLETAKVASCEEPDSSLSLPSEPSAVVQREAVSVPETESEELQSAPAVQPKLRTPTPPASHLFTPAQPVAVTQTDLKQPAPQRKSGEHETAIPNEAVPVDVKEPVPVQQSDDKLEQAVTSGVMKEPKPQLKKTIQNANGVVSLEKQALARLLASF